jgi:hypothetical protein
MEAYDAALVEAGFVFVDDLDEDETTLTFLATPHEKLTEPEAPANPT